MDDDGERLEEQLQAVERDIERHLHAWQRQVLDGIYLTHVESELGQQQRQELARKISCLLTYTLHGADPWYSPEDALERIVSRPRRAPEMPALAAGQAVQQEIAACLLHWQLLLMAEFEGPDYFDEGGVQDLRAELTRNIAMWLVQPISGYDPWYDHPEAMVRAIAYQILL
jgi:hypothetical protein